ncbi:MAG: molybdenum cofactor guanylyltransferase [Spirochaetaceae bacterium]|jgi:molybdopterin-guanine dinucleotide biosynthesis protein A|nr:molybdenum cofactor guanylyltransferase [Spirochaetaceae bacterium]
MSNDEQSRKTFGALILAGGAGRRIGFDKKLLTVDGEPVIEKQIGVLSAAFNEVIVSANGGFTERKGVSVVKDVLGSGPLAGIYSGLLSCKSDFLFVAACDMPFLSGAWIARLKEVLWRNDCDVCAAAREDGFIEPFNAFYGKTAIGAVKQSLEAGVYKIQFVLKKLNVFTIPKKEAEALCPFSAQGRGLFFNINFKEDLEKAQSAAFR